MSDTFPPGPPGAPGPSGASGRSPQHQPEYLEAGGGSPLAAPPAEPTPRGGRRRGLLIGGGIAVLAAVGVGAWAAAQFFSTGAQPAQALPASTIGYASIDLDPSGGQKIEALRTLNKFPAFKDQVGLNTDDDIRKKLFDTLDQSGNCGLDYAKDVEPWLGDRFAVALVDTGDGKPSPVAVLQVTDANGADAGLAKIRDCANPGSGNATGGWTINGDWAILADSDVQAKKVADLTDQGSLADDADFQQLTSAAGDPGIVALYAAPGAGKYLSPSAGDLGGFAGALEQGLTGVSGGDTDPMQTTDLQTPLSTELANFKGMAVTVRFSGGALEVESAGDPGLNLSSFYASGRGGDVLETMPDDTAVAVGVGFDRGWFGQLVDQVANVLGENPDDLMKQASDTLGIDVPADVETLFGDSAAFGFSSDFDPQTFFDSTDASDLPLALKVHGDPAAIKAVLAKLTAGNPQEPDTASFVGTDEDGDTIVVGPNADYRKKVLARGTLGSNHVYQDVVRESDKASMVVFVDFDAGDWLVKAVGNDQSVKENVDPLAGFGISVWKDGDLVHGVMRLTTD